MVQALHYGILFTPLEDRRQLMVSFSTTDHRYCQTVPGQLRRYVCHDSLNDGPLRTWETRFIFTHTYFPLLVQICHKSSF